jgi:hypothetical protein
VGTLTDSGGPSFVALTGTTEREDTTTDWGSPSFVADTGTTEREETETDWGGPSFVALTGTTEREETETDWGGPSFVALTGTTVSCGTVIVSAAELGRATTTIGTAARTRRANPRRTLGRLEPTLGFTRPP